MNFLIKLGYPALTTSILVLLSLLSSAGEARFSHDAPGKIDDLGSTSTATSLAIDSVTLTDQQGEYPLGLHLQIFEDPTDKLTISQVSSPAYNSRFVPSHVATPNLGYTQSAIWLRFAANNQTQQTSHWLLAVDYPNLQYLDLYSPLPGGNGFAVKQSGALRPASSRDIFAPHVTFSLSIPSHTQATFYLRVFSGSSMTIPLVLWAPTAYINSIVPVGNLLGALYGILIGLLAYNIFLLFSVKEKSYLYLILFLASYLLWNASNDGYTEIYLFRTLSYLKVYYHSLFFAGFMASVILFADTLLDFQSRKPFLHQLVRINLAVWGLLLVSMLFTPFYVYAQLMVAWAIPTMAVPLLGGILFWRQGTTTDHYFLIAWFGLLVGVILNVLVRFSILPSTFLIENMYRVGVVWMAVFWSIALANRINLLKAATENANREIRQSESRLRQILSALPLGVVEYDKNLIPLYMNPRYVEILSNPSAGIHPDLNAMRTIEQAIEYYSLRIAGTEDKYPLEKLPIYCAIQGEPASVDDIEANIGDKQVQLELWSSPVKDEMGFVETAVSVMQDITQRKKAEAELVEYHKHLEELVEQRTAELDTTNKELKLHLEWLEAVNLVNQTIARTADFSQIYAKIVEIIKQLFRTQDSFIAELEANQKQLKILAHSCHRDSHPDLVGASIVLPDSILSNTSADKEKIAIISKDQVISMDDSMRWHIQTSKVQSIVFVPLLLREQILGLLGLELQDPGRNITIDEANLLNIFSTDIAHLIEDARLFEQARTLIAVEERNHLARELHDSVAQALYSISLFTDATRRAMEANKQEVVKNHLEELVNLSQDAMLDMRLMIFELRPPVLENYGLTAALQHRLESVESRAGFQASLETRGEFHLSTDQENELYWIAQEALNNVIKHAQAGRVKIYLEGDEGKFRMTIEDNGVGFDFAAGEQAGGQGLRNILERAEKIEAKCSIESVAGKGTKIRVELGG